MKALIFVYTNAQLRITGASSIKQFPFQACSFDAAPSIAGSGTVTLEKGIYGMFSDQPKGRIEITATSGMKTVDYDTETGDGKETWPELAPSPGAVSAEFQTVYDRVHTQFPDLKDAELCMFIDGKGARL